MPEERITLNFKEKRVVWNREVLYQDYDNANSKAFIIAGNENSWLQILEGKYFTPDFYVQLIELGLTYVKLYIKYGTDAPMKWKCSGAPGYICYQSNDGTYNTKEECQAACKGPTCNPVWKCEEPRNGYSTDGCGMRRQDTRCDPLVSVPMFLTSDKTTIQVGDIVTFSGKYKTGAVVIIKEVGLFGTEIARATCNSAGNFSVAASIKLSEGVHTFEAISDSLILPDTSGKISITIIAKDAPCAPNWVCELPLNGYETDGCGHRAYNSLCLPETGTPCADGNTRTIPCPEDPSKTIDQQCIGGKWTNVSDDCGGKISTGTLIIIGVVVIVFLVIILRGRR